MAVLLNHRSRGRSHASGAGTRVYDNDGTSCERSPDAYRPLTAAARGYAHLFTSNGQTCGFNTLTSGNEQKLNDSADLLDGVVSTAAHGHGF